MLHHADDLIKTATGYLCIGYGFNDEQIQSTMIEEIKLGRPVIVVTKAVSESTASMLLNNSDNYIIVHEATDGNHQTEFIINGKYVYSDENYWSMDGFVNIFS